MSIPQNITWLCKKYFADVYLVFSELPFAVLASPTHEGHRSIALSLATVFDQTNLANIMQINLDEVNDRSEPAVIHMPDRVTYRGCLYALREIFNNKSICSNIGFEVLIAADYLGIKTHEFRCDQYCDLFNNKHQPGCILPSKDELLNHRRFAFQVAKSDSSITAYNLLAQHFSYKDWFLCGPKLDVAHYLMDRGDHRSLARHILTLDTDGKLGDALIENLCYPAQYNVADLLLNLADINPNDVFINGKVVAYHVRQIIVVHDRYEIKTRFRVKGIYGKRVRDGVISYSRCPFRCGCLDLNCGCQTPKCNCDVVDSYHKPRDMTYTEVIKNVSRLVQWENGKKFVSELVCYERGDEEIRLMMTNIYGVEKLLTNEEGSLKLK